MAQFRWTMNYLVSNKSVNSLFIHFMRENIHEANYYKHILNMYAH